MRIEKCKMETTKGRLEYSLSGNGQPHVVLINGGSGPIEGWMRILPEISQWATVFSYNRLGVAGSDKPREPQDGLTIVETLREVLHAAGLQPPYLLVGHSLGGLYAQLFARLYPNEAAAVILIESSHPRDLDLDKYQGGFVKALNKLLSMFDSFSAHKKYDEVQFVKRTVDQLLQSDAFPPIPLYVITGGKENRMMPEEARKKRRENQLDFLTLSPNSHHIIAEQSGHFPQLQEPRIVIDTIKACVEAVSAAE